MIEYMIDITHNDTILRMEIHADDEIQHSPEIVNGCCIPSNILPEIFIEFILYNKSDSHITDYKSFAIDTDCIDITRESDIPKTIIKFNHETGKYDKLNDNSVNIGGIDISKLLIDMTQELHN